MKLHYVPRTRANRARWLMEEAGAIHELARVDVAGGHNKSDAYRAVHPHGSVPALTIDDVSIIESAAICLAIADKFPEKHLAPEIGTLARAKYYQWMVYVPATMDPCISAIMKSQRLPPDQQERAAMDEKARWKEIAGFVERSLSDNEYLVENRFSAADVMVGAALLWADRGGLLKGYEPLDKYITRLKSRMAFQRAMKE
jgi:glutathione S-transferase